MENVRDVYTELLGQGYTKKDAAKEAQSRTGFSVVTGRPITEKLDFNIKGNVPGFNTRDLGKPKFGQF